MVTRGHYANERDGEIVFAGMSRWRTLEDVTQEEARRSYIYVGTIFF